MNRKYIIAAGLGCALLLLLAGAAIIAVFVPLQVFRSAESGVRQERVVQVTTEVTVPVATTAPGFVETQEAVPTLEPETTAAPTPAAASLPANLALTELYAELNPGVVNVQVFITQGLGGQGAGSGFILDEEGHIITNNHVVADADDVTVIFYNGFESHAEVIGLDDDSDLAVLRVDEMAEGAFPLPLGDSDEVEAGEWVIAIGNPFSLGGSITLGIVSAVGRSIPSGVTPFSIPQAIQTDAAINPGNSGGPLLDLNGRIIGVNAQIRTTAGVAANSGVGFAVPVNVVRRIAPALIAQGRYEWPWLGVNNPASVNLLLQQANGLETQQGVYIHQVVPGGPADRAGLQGSTDVTLVNGLEIPTGGDVILEVDGERLESLDELLSAIAFRDPGDDMQLTVLRDGRQEQLTVTLDARPQEFDQLGQP
ncbi:MAG: trypsin-like peptidase domain-containing protein [Anaerolineales bacterium]|nr:trypsin-like peptidase domain-containing protein [Anaerolineales bacterium]